MNSFGSQLWPDAERKNIEYGALDLKAFNLLMSNGDEGNIEIIQTLGNGQAYSSLREISSPESPTAQTAPIASTSILLPALTLRN